MIKMKNKQFLTVLLLSFLTGGIILAQESSSELTLSLKEAQEYAIMNNKAVNDKYSSYWTALS